MMVKPLKFASRIANTFRRLREKKKIRTNEIKALSVALAFIQTFGVVFSVLGAAS